MMKCICDKRCIIGEGPIWNEKEQKLYFTNGFGNEICILNIESGERDVIEGIQAAAFAFDEDNRLIISSKKGIFYLNDDNSLEEICLINNCNDMKVGPDRKIYVGTQSSKRLGLSDKIDGKLYSIDKKGDVKILLNNLLLSNGMDWSIDEKRFYHTDSDTNIIKEYDFDKKSGNIEYTGRCINVPGVDGLTVDKNDNLYVACWGQGHIAVVNTKTMEITDYIKTPAKIPVSCCFCGKDMNILAVVTASYGCNDENAGQTFATRRSIGGRLPYLFGGKY